MSTSSPVSRARDECRTPPAAPDLSTADLAAALAAERDECPWSQARLDEEAGLTAGYVAKLESGARRLSESTSRRLAEALARGQAAAQGRTATPVDVAVLDLRLQRAAPDLRRWARRKPYSLRRQRVYAAAAARLDAPRPPGPAERLELARVLAALTLPDPVTPPDPTTLETA